MSSLTPPDRGDARITCSRQTQSPTPSRPLWEHHRRQQSSLPTAQEAFSAIAKQAGGRRAACRPCEALPARSPSPSRIENRAGAGYGWHRTPARILVGSCQPRREYSAGTSGKWRSITSPAARFSAADSDGMVGADSTKISKPRLDHGRAPRHEIGTSQRRNTEVRLTHRWSRGASNRWSFSRTRTDSSSFAIVEYAAIVQATAGVPNCKGAKL